jgi:hypothetical protein
MKKNVFNTTNDLILYLEDIKRLAKSLAPDQKAQLQQILSTILTLLVCMRQASHLGETKITTPLGEFDV